MKLRLLLSLAVTSSLVSCGSFQGPIGEGDFDPLTAPGSLRQSNDEENGGLSFVPGQFVRASMDNTAFFVKRPRGNADADKMLKLGSQMKMIATDGAYLKVELDSGEVGYVPTVMVSDPTVQDDGIMRSPNEVPIITNFEALPPVDQTLPVVPPGEAPAEDSVPTVIDPAASPNEVPIPAPADAKPPVE